MKKIIIAIFFLAVAIIGYALSTKYETPTRDAKGAVAYGVYSNGTIHPLQVTTNGTLKIQ